MFSYSSFGDVLTTNCTFQNNSATFGGGGVFMYSSGDVSITNCNVRTTMVLIVVVCRWNHHLVILASQTALSEQQCLLNLVVVWCCIPHLLILVSQTALFRTTELLMVVV